MSADRERELHDLREMLAQMKLKADPLVLPPPPKAPDVPAVQL